MELRCLLRCACLFPMLLMLASASFTARADCSAAATTREDALRKADWIMEGKVEIIAVFRDPQAPEVILDHTKVIQQREPSRSGKTVGISMGPCFPGGAAALLGKAGDRMTGQRMRFFGNRHSTDPSRRFFFAEPAQIPLVPIRGRADQGALKSTVHGIGLTNPLPHGWHRATSTGGRFAIDLPGPFLDATVVKNGHPSFLLRSKDRNGAVFIAAYEHSGPDSALARSFDQSMAEPGVTARIFRGMPM